MGDIGGVVSGLALRAIRSRVGATQADLAETLRVDLSTVKGWESGRRALGRAKAGDVAALQFRLQLLGAAPEELAGLDDAVRADWLLGAAISHDGGPHPLAHQVMTRDTTQLLSWPLTGVAPSRFGGKAGRPALAAGERGTVYSALRDGAERSLALPSDPRGPLLRRNAYYLLAADPGSRDWLRDAARTEKRRMPRLDRWTPEWVLHRSLAVAWSMAGNPGPLREFLDRGLATDATLAASLNYWAAWCGEDHATYHSDEFMAGDLGTWRGDKLLTSLTSNLTTATGYLELCIRAVWALIERRPHLLDDPDATSVLSERVAALLEGGAVRDGARRDLEQILYATRWRR